MKLFKINCIGNIHLYNAFIPLIQKGEVKKVVNISTGMADLDWVNQYDIEVSPLYAMSKAAMNTVTAKFSAQYKKEGILFLAVCPGMVDVGHYAKGTLHGPMTRPHIFHPPPALSEPFGMMGNFVDTDMCVQIL